MTDWQDKQGKPPASSLHEIESAFCRLWVDGAYRKSALVCESSQQNEVCPSERELLKTVDRRGVALYASLFRQRFLAVMNCVYPSCGKLLKTVWRDTVDAYFEAYPPRQDRLNWVARDFPRFLKEKCPPLLERYPFLPELADYEWTVRLVLDNEAIIQRFPHEPLLNQSQLQSLRPAVNPALEVRIYRYPVPLIADRLVDWSNSDKLEPAPMCMLLYRDPDSHEYKVLDVGGVTGRLVEVAMSSACSYDRLFARVSDLTGQSDYKEHLQEYIAVVEQLQAKNVYVGSVPVTCEGP